METRNNDTTQSQTSTTPTRTQTVSVPKKSERERTPAVAAEEYKRVSLPNGVTIAFTDHTIRLYDVDPVSAATTSDSDSDTPANGDSRELVKYRELTNAEVAEILTRLYR